MPGEPEYFDFNIAPLGGKCMRRRLFNALAWLSLLICVVTTALWAHSYWSGAVLSRQAQVQTGNGWQSITALWCDRGRVTFQRRLYWGVRPRQRYQKTSAYGVRWTLENYPGSIQAKDRLPGWRDDWDASAINSEMPQHGRPFDLVVPDWSIVLGASILPVISWSWNRRAKRSATSVAPKPAKQRSAVILLRALFYGLAIVSLLIFLPAAWFAAESHVNENTLFAQIWDYNGDLTRSRIDEFTVTVEAGQLQISDSFVKGNIINWNGEYWKRFGQNKRLFNWLRVPVFFRLGVNFRNPSQMNWLNRLGFDFMARIIHGDLRPANLQGIGEYRYWSILCPAWVAPILLLILPILALRPATRQVRAGSRIRRGLCSHCGYDLRATPDRCPECGTVKAIAR
jgi:hypothetical protein